MRLPFDAHNHIHLGPTNPVQALTSPLEGLAIMSTHPRDYRDVEELTQSILPSHYPSVKAVPNFGVHPWFLHELSEDDWASTNDAVPPSKDKKMKETDPLWLQELESMLERYPHASLGEIGLDGYHYNYETKQLTTSMEEQVHAFELQLKLAHRLDRSVSIHAVQCMGPLMTSLSKYKSRLPPKMYFHAFGGKAATIPQLLALCQKSQVYFGFAPLVNSKSPKTPQAIREAGLDRLVLETDHEDASLVPESIEKGIDWLSETLGVPRQEVIDQTTRNAYVLYGLESS